MVPSILTIAAFALFRRGLVDKLYVRAEQQRVTQNQPLARLWIPEWNAAQQEYLAIRQLGDRALTAAARQKLQLLLMPEEVIRTVERSGQPQTRVTLRAPASGFISQLSVREGSQVTVAQPLFELASLDPLWLVANFPQAQAGAVAAGDDIVATTARWPDMRFHGRVEELLPGAVWATGLKSSTGCTTGIKSSSPGNSSSTPRPACAARCRS